TEHMCRLLIGEHEQNVRPAGWLPSGLLGGLLVGHGALGVHEVLGVVARVSSAGLTAPAACAHGSPTAASSAISSLRNRSASAGRSTRTSRSCHGSSARSYRCIGTRPCCPRRQTRRRSAVRQPRQSSHPAVLGMRRYSAPPGRSKSRPISAPDRSRPCIEAGTS